MALSASSINSMEQVVFGNKRIVFANINGDASYSTGGSALTASWFGLSSITFCIPITSSGFVLNWVKSSGKLQAFNPTGGTGTGTANTAAPPAGATAVTSTSAQPAMPITPGPGTEVAATTDLSSHLFNLVLIGV